jgi:DNA ligase-associated metallophosphoesterase
MRIEIGGAPVTLLPSGGAWIQEEDTVLVADLHLGKGAAFRAAGHPVPTGTSRETLERLSAVVAAAPSARVLWVLGDLFHAGAGVTPDLAGSWARWQRHHPGLTVGLVAGNHDRGLEEVARSWRMEVAGEGIRVGGFLLAHHPPETPQGPTVAGHLHPVLRLRDGRRWRMRSPCFWLRNEVLILPALGALVDGAGIRSGAGDRVFVPAGDQVLEIPSAQLPSSARAG